MKDRKKLALMCACLAIFAALIAVFAGIWIMSRSDSNKDTGNMNQSDATEETGNMNQSDATVGTKTFTLTVVHGDGTSKDFTITTSREFLADALLDENLIVESDSPGMYNTVDGETADYSVDQSYWCFYVGDEYAMEGMNTTLIVEGGKYKLEYTD